MNIVALTLLVFAVVALLIIAGRWGENIHSGNLPQIAAPSASKSMAEQWEYENESTPYTPPKVSIDEYYNHFFNVTLPEIRCQALLAKARQDAEDDRRIAEINLNHQRSVENRALYDEFVRNARKEG